MEILAFWFGMAVVTGLAAAARGRSGFGWFILGLLFSVIALLAVLVMRNLRAEEERRALARIAAGAAVHESEAEAERRRVTAPLSSKPGPATPGEWRAAIRAASSRGGPAGGSGGGSER